MSIAAKQKELIATMIAAGLVAIVVGALALTHQRPEGAIFLSVFAVFALAVAFTCAAIIFRDDQQSPDETSVRRHTSYGIVPPPADPPTIPMANPATGLPLIRGSNMDIGGNTHGQAQRVK